jgi:hypothetical protein
MANAPKIREIAKFSSIEESVKKLNSDAQKIRALAHWITKNVRRDEKSVSMVNIAEAVAAFLNVAAQGTTTHISVLALATRNLFELNVRLRDTLRSDEQLKRWHGEAIRDNVELLEGLMRLDNTGENAQSRDVLQKEIDRLHGLQKKYGLPQKGSPPAKNLAVGVGLEDEYNALFKVFSKLVHPTSYLVNNIKNANTHLMIGLLQVHAQIYSADTYSRLMDEFFIPHDHDCI